MTTTMLERGALSELREGFGGQVLRPDDPGYDEARTLYNAMIDRRPALVARCAGTADVVAAVRYARARELPIAIRCGGHSVAGHSVCDDGLLIDLSLLKGVHVEPSAGLARAGGGVTWGEYDRETQVFGLATPGGRATTTGIGGFTLGGGYGWISPKFGLTCDNLVSAEVVTADGRVVTGSERENEDLLWGLRGGGGNFGVVTSFQYRVHPVGPIVLGGLLVFDFDHAEDAVGAYRDVAETAPDELATALVLLNAPPAPPVPQRLHGKPALAVAVAYCGDPSAGERLVAPLRAQRPAADMVGRIPYTALQALLDDISPHGWRNYWRGLHLQGLSDDALRTMLQLGPFDLAPMSFLVLFQHGGAIGRVNEDAAAFSHREAKYMIHPISCWLDDADDDRQMAWVRQVSEAMEPYRTGGAYLNMTADASSDRVWAGSQKWQSLVALKKAYDPDNVFRFNQNIRPEEA
jgi:FAD/FMN-containing dehydrogenase